MRVRTSGKFLRLGNTKFFVKGFSYGPFAPDNLGDFLPSPTQVLRDFEQIKRLGGNALRLYHSPPNWFLDACQEHGLRVLVDIPWDKHRCFFEDWQALDQARQRVRRAAQQVGAHPATLAISVVNEIPNDIVRFYGRDRIAAFIDELLDVAKQASPDCLATFVNFPTTEFLQPKNHDFSCFNVYLHDPMKLGEYLDRLQHLAGNKPLILGEYGVDTIREGEDEQARLLGNHVHQVFRHGLSGSFIFSYTDAWFTADRWVDDWAFGVTRADRTEKEAATVLQTSWNRVPYVQPLDWRKVSVVVCTYNGGRTLRRCLESLMNLNYPDYEVIVVNDGSTDNTAQIVADYPQVVCITQANSGLSVARNVGAKAATGEIVAYTDDDCVADEDWLNYLVQELLVRNADGVGGPNIPPPDDSWCAKCVAASPGGPSHVMLDDHFAEHVPGCNMAFFRHRLFEIGGFDPQFRQAGDDVDICWRLLDANMKIAFAPGAMVWHFRRNSVSAYLRQQKGYGKSEAMVHFKHPQRFSALGRSRWKGVIYGEGAVGLPLLPPAIYHGQHGSAPFQTIYQQSRYSLSGWTTTLEWHVIALFLVLLGSCLPELLMVPLGMWLTTILVVIGQVQRTHLPRGAPGWCRWLVAYLYLLQPVVRGWHRQTHLLRNKILPPASIQAPQLSLAIRRIRPTEWDIYWNSENRQGRESLLRQLALMARRAGWSGHYDDNWSEWDLKLVGDRWHDIRIRTATEELKWPQRFTRVRSTAHATDFARCLIAAELIAATVFLMTAHLWCGLAALGCGLVSVVRLFVSRTNCLSSVTQLIWRAGRKAGLQPVNAFTGELLVDEIESKLDPMDMTASSVDAPQSQVLQTK